MVEDGDGLLGGEGKTHEEGMKLHLLRLAWISPLGGREEKFLTTRRVPSMNTDGRG